MRPKLCRSGGACSAFILLTLVLSTDHTANAAEDDKTSTSTTSTSTPTSETPWMGGGISTTVRTGEHALLTCVVRGAEGHAIMWRRARDHLLLTAAKVSLTQDERIQVLHDDAEEIAGAGGDAGPGGAVWALVIRNANVNDSGLYVCELNTEPPVRSFHKLIVMPAAIASSLMPPTIEATDSYSSNARTPSLAARVHNYTDCCVASNVSHGCLGYCSIQAILDGSTGQEPENCESEFGTIVKCMADSRNHVPCCIHERVPDICQDVCRGEYTPITDNIKTHFSCAAYTDQTLACIVEGIEILPSAPEEVFVESVNEKALKISWSTPLKNGGTVIEYLINITALRTFDAHMIEPSESSYQSGPKSQLYSVQLKVPSNKNDTVVDMLVPFTMYEVKVIAYNIHGSSLPSDSVRVLTKTPTKPRAPGDVAASPPLPNVEQCCITAGVSHSGCLSKLCNPRKTKNLDVTELMVCAPWAPMAFTCLSNGMDHSPCCKNRGLQDLCLSLCTGNVTSIDFNYFKCMRQMPEYSNCLLQGYGVLPSAPMKVHATNVATDYAIIHWSSPNALADTVLHYNLHYRRLDERDDDSYIVVEMVTSPYILEDLSSNTDYEVFIEAQNEYGTGEPSARLIFRTQSLTDEELEFALVDNTAAYNVTACCEHAGLSSSCMELCTYDASMSRLRALAGVCSPEFHKLLRCGAGGRDHTPCCKRRGVPLECDSLCSGTMSPKKGACLPYIGNVLLCFEEGTDKLPGPPRELHAVTITDTNIQINWNSPDDGQNATSFTVHYQKGNNLSAVSYIDYTLDNQLTALTNGADLKDLTPGTIYHIFVVANNEEGSSLPSSVLVVNATKQDLGPDGLKGVPSPPHSLAVSGHSATWVTISWQPPLLSHPDDKVSYTLYFKPTGNDTFTAIKTTVTSHTLEKLSPNSQYIVYVSASVPAGTSLPSETLVAWTDPAYPAFVEPPTVHPVNLVVEGSSMTILCIAMGTPMPTISLYISGRLVRQDITRHMVTVIHNVTRDMDQISCYADNGYGTPMQASRKITISHPPSIQASGITMAAAGDSVVLECRVESLPRPQVAFWRDAQGRVPVIQGPKYNIELLQDSEGDSKYTMRLTINKLTEPDEGDYFCHAENAFGFALRPVSVRLRPETHAAAALNVTDCCIRQNVSSGCMDACGLYLDMDEVTDRSECVADFDKLMRCAADGSDHRGCCANAGVPRACLELCRGGAAPRACALQHARRALGCFRAHGAALPGPPTALAAAPGPSPASVVLSWRPPAKNPDSVEVYRVFWREVGGKAPNRLDTPDTHATLADLKDGVQYECVVKAGNHLGTSSLTDPIQFTAGAVGAEGSTGSPTGAVVGGILACLLGAMVLVAAVYLYRRHKNLRLKSQGGVAFENPSYLREGNTESLPNGNGTTPNGIPSATTASINSTSVSNSAGWRQESLHTPQEVNPSLYEELKLGHDGAGFKRLK